MRAGWLQSRAAAAGAVALVAVVVYLGSLANGFAYDDVPLLTGDPRVHGFLMPDLIIAPYWPGSAGYELGIYRPLTTVSFAIDWALGNGSPLWFHLMNVFWHAVASALVCLLLAELFAPAAALAGALLFAVHPVLVEAVANVAGRAELLAAVFFLAACLLWLRSSAGLIGRRRILGVAALYALALGAKENAAVLPAIVLLLDAAAGKWRVARESALTYLRQRGPNYVSLAIVLGLYLLARYFALGSLAPSIRHPAAEVLSGAGDRLLTALQAWSEFLRLLLFPRTLLIDYGPQILMPTDTWTGSATLGAVVLLTTLGGGLLALARGYGRTALGLLWFPITILPVANLLVVVGVLVAERTLYLPSVALSFGFAAVAVWARAAAPLHWRRVVLAGALAALALLTIRTLVRVPEWKSTDTAFQALLRDRPDAYRAHWYLGRVARQRGDLLRAHSHYWEALTLWPYRRELIIEATAVAALARRFGDAQSLAAFAVRRWPDAVAAHRLLAATSLDRGDTAAARAALDAGLSQHPTDGMLRAMARSLERVPAAANER